MKSKITKILIIILMLMPAIDVLTSLITRFLPNVISIGVIVKGLLSLLCVSYVFFVSKSKYKKVSIYAYAILALFSIIYLLTKIK